MAVTNPIEGKYVSLRSCTEYDAEFTRAIRRDPEFAKYLPVIDNTLEEQKNWINQQRKTEGDYFWVVWDKDGKRIGTISIYNVDGERAEGGRLAIKGSNPFQALEAQMLSFRFAFNVLHLKCIESYIFADNDRALRFNHQFAGRQRFQEMDKNGRNTIKVENWAEDFEQVDKKISSVLYRKKIRR